MSEASPPLRPLPVIVGTIVLALVTLAALRDVETSVTNWDSYGPVSVDDPLPAFSVRLDDGTPLAHTDLEGQVSLLTFWATWCHACEAEMPTITALQSRYASEGLQIYGVNRDSDPIRQRRAKVERFTAANGMRFPQIYDDGQLARGFRVEAIPHMVLVDRDGRIRYVHIGRVSERVLRREIDDLLDD